MDFISIYINADFMIIFYNFIFYIFIILISFTTHISANMISEMEYNETTLLTMNIETKLNTLQNHLDVLKQQVSNATTDNQLSTLNDNVLQLVVDSNMLVTILKPYLIQIQGQLEVLGPPPPESSTIQETSAVIQSRNNLNTRKALLNSQIERANIISSSANKLSMQIVDIRRNTMRSQMALNSGSIFSLKFWSPILKTQSKDMQHLTHFYNNFIITWKQAWSSEWRWSSGILLFFAVLSWCFGSRWLDKPFYWCSVNILPEGTLRRSFLACSTVLVTLLNVSIGAQLIYWFFTRLPYASNALIDFSDGVLRLTFFSSLIAGLGRSFLSNYRTSLRVLEIPDSIALSLKPLPSLLAAFILISGAIEQLNRSAGTTISATIFGYGISALLIVVIVLIGLIRIRKLQYKLKITNTQLDMYSPIVNLIQICIIILAILILIFLFIGYISLARFLTYELVWIAMIISLFYLLIHLVVDLFQNLFSSNTVFGTYIKQTFNLHDRHLSQISVLLIAFGKTLLIVFGAIALINGNFGSTTPLALLHKILDVWGGKGLEKINIIPANILNAFISLIISLYILRSSKNWLEKEFLPQTTMEPGIRSSLVTLFSNIGYVLIILLSLSILGIQWNNLAWIVSALSVGIGFGLQEIVKNFISGLILLTERPIKVGDLISISGIEGDIRRIKVRATEIQLGDRSTVIIPNSQLISQNVRNATMGNVPGVATILLTFPLDIDPVQVRLLLLDIYRKHEAIQKLPPPSVNFSQLTPTGIVLSATGFVRSPRFVTSTKSDLLFKIFHCFRENNIKLSMPQKITLENI